MLVELRIRNFAIIEELSLELSSGLNVISGETGSGKSLILDAFQLILGARPKTSYFRKNTDGWEIEALLSLDDTPSPLRELLPEQVRDADEILLTRTMSTSGRGKVFMNGKLATVQMLQDIASKMLALCTQGQQMQLHDPDYLLSLVDEYVGAMDLLSDYQKMYGDLKRLEGELARYLVDKEARVLKQAETEFLLHELGTLAPYAGMREELQKRLTLLKNSQNAASSIQKVSSLLLDHSGAYSLLEHIRKELSQFPSEMREKCDEKVQLAEDALSDLERTLSSFDLSEEGVAEALEEVSHNLSELARLERKYKTDDAGLSLLFEKASGDTDDGEGERREALLREAIEERRGAVQEVAGKIRKLRYAGAKKFQQAVKDELGDLGMPEVKLDLKFDEHEAGPFGTESVRFLFSPNPGEEARELQEIASGGELSRVMLVIKKLFRDRSGVSILVFDEVDTGVSGAVAQAVGEKMSEISQFSQVVCITHLPQVACYADSHFSIAKEKGARTKSTVKSLDYDDRLEELAKMLSGYKVTPAARESARVLLSSKGSKGEKGVVGG